MPEKIDKSCFPPELDDFIDLSEKLGEGIYNIITLMHSFFNTFLKFVISSSTFLHFHQENI